MKVYYLKCQHCGKIEERTHKLEKITCFSCKKKRQREWHRDMKELRKQLAVGQVI